jgi:GlpG protein
MRDFHTAVSVGVDEDLLPLSALLHQRGVVHRIFEENGRQVLKVERRDQVRPVAELHRAWRAGEVRIELRRGRRAVPLHSAVNWRQAPVTLALILFSAAGFLLFYLGAPLDWLAALTFTPFKIVNGKPLFGAVEGQYWRLITPVFLHFGWLHIVFNCLWLWELGSRVERVMGQINMLLLFLVIALVSNTSQFAFGGPSLFGGMSGVVYGLLGFSWVAPLLQPRWALRPAPAIMVLMVGWLVACTLGVVEVLGFGAVANAAHLGGLLCGAALGAAFGLLSRMGGESTAGD